MDERTDRTLNNLYLTRYAYPVEFLTTKIPALDLGIVIVIPSFAEKNLSLTLKSINNCQSAGCSVEVIVVINHPEYSKEEIVLLNKKTLSSLRLWAEKSEQPWLKFHFIPAFDLPFKKAGVGLARKIGMDEAVRRFSKINNSRGIIACLDADCLCDPNYLVEIFKLFQLHPEINGASVYFEHPLEGNLSPDIYDGIVDYELHLRYMVNALKFAGYPYAYPTVGSCMVIPSNIYQLQGGMNTRKAGEDFYFLHKIFQLGHFHEINSTRVIPSPRISERVPFGTGKAMKDWAKHKNLLTYNPQIYKDLGRFIDIINSIYGLTKKDFSRFAQDMPESMQSYIPIDNWIRNINNCIEISRNEETFRYRVYHWFSGLKIIKFLNFAALRFYPNVSLEEAVSWLLKSRYGSDLSKSFTRKDLLLLLRTVDRAGRLN
jgi:hypothetical protein